MMNNILDFSNDYLRQHPDTNYFIYGHLHLLRDIRLAPQARMIVLGEWLSSFSYAVWDGNELSLLFFSEEKI